MTKSLGLYLRRDLNEVREPVFQVLGRARMASIEVRGAPKGRSEITAQLWSHRNI